MLLQLLYQVALVEKLLEGEVGLVEDGVDGGDVGVAAEAPEHGASAVVEGPKSRRQLSDARRGTRFGGVRFGGGGPCSCR